MASTRLELLHSMVEQKPQDAFVRYALAMEYVNSGDLAGAVTQFTELLKHNPTYAAGYFQGGQALANLGRTDEARDLFKRGIDVTTASGDEHTRSELMGALQMLG
jgi:Flp pilus assembly protein TadD